jgi:hypothetical protein
MYTFSSRFLAEDIASEPEVAAIRGGRNVRCDVPILGNLLKSQDLLLPNPQGGKKPLPTAAAHALIRWS